PTPVTLPAWLFLLFGRLGRFGIARFLPGPFDWPLFSVCLGSDFVTGSRLGLCGSFSLLALALRQSHLLSAFETGEVILVAKADVFRRLRPNAFDGFELLRRHVSQGFNRGYSSGFQLLNQAFPETLDTFERRGRRARELGHLRLNFLALLLLALDVNLPAEKF